jgi:hypothetical protein
MAVAVVTANLSRQKFEFAMEHGFRNPLELAENNQPAEVAAVRGVIRGVPIKSEQRSGLWNFIDEAYITPHIIVFLAFTGCSFPHGTISDWWQKVVFRHLTYTS